MTTAETSSKWLSPEDKQPATSFAELRRRAAIDISVADEHPLGYWVNVAEELFNEAETAYTAGELERAYIIYMRACRIVYKVIPNHSDYHQSGLLADPLDQDVQQRAVHYFPRVMREIVVPLRMKFRKSVQIGSNPVNSRAAAKWTISDDDFYDDDDNEEDDDDDASQYEESQEYFDQESIPSNSLAYTVNTPNENAITSSRLDTATSLKNLAGQERNENVFNDSNSQTSEASTPSIVAEVTLVSALTIASSASSSALTSTNSPAVAPINSPAVAPTSSPAVAPTSPPAVAPTSLPAVAPTSSSAVATEFPTVAPAKSPTVTSTDSSAVAFMSSVIASTVVQAPAVRPTNSKTPDVNSTSPMVGWATIQPSASSSTSPVAVSTAVQTPAVKSVTPAIGWATTQTSTISSTSPVAVSTVQTPAVKSITPAIGRAVVQTPAVSSVAISATIQPPAYTPSANPPRAPEPRFINNLPAGPSRTENSALLQQKLKRPILPSSVSNQQSHLPPLPSNLPTPGESSQSAPGPLSNFEFPHEHSINPQQLERYMTLNTSALAILFLDIRPREMYERARLKHSHVVNLEPAILRNGVSGLELENALSAAAANTGDTSRARELEHFKKRNLFKGIVYYDQNTLSAKAPTNPFDPFRHMIHALYEKEFSAKSLSRPPVLLAGGFEAWARYRGEDGVEGSMVNAGSDKTEMQDSGDKIEVEDLPVEGAIEVNNGDVRRRYSATRASNGDVKRRYSTRASNGTVAPIDVEQTRIYDGSVDRRQQPTRTVQDYFQSSSSQQANRVATTPLIIKPLPKLPQETLSSSYAPDSPITPDSPRTPADYLTATLAHTRVPSDNSPSAFSVDRGFRNAVSSNQSNSLTLLTRRTSIHEPHNTHARRSSNNTHARHSSNPSYRSDIYPPIDNPPTSSADVPFRNTNYNIYPQLSALQSQPRQLSQTTTPPGSSGPNRSAISASPMPHQHTQQLKQDRLQLAINSNSWQVQPPQAPQNNDTFSPRYMHHGAEILPSRTFEHTNHNAYGVQAYTSQSPPQQPLHATDSHFRVSQPPSQRGPVTPPAMFSVEPWRLQTQQAQGAQQNQHTQQPLASNNLPPATSLEELRVRAWVSITDKEKILISGWIHAAKVCGEEGSKRDSWGDLENAYVFYLKCVSIIDEIIPEHSAYQLIHDDSNYMALQKIVDEYRKRLKDIALMLSRRFNEITLTELPN